MTFTAPMPEHDFGFDETTVFDYTHGDCWWLALALEQAVNLPVVALWGNGEIQHVGVELPNGLIVDIAGVWTTSAWLNYWYDELDDCDEVYYDDITMEDDNWCCAVNVYSEAILDQKVVSGAPTLRETMTIIIDALHSLNLLSKPAA